MKEIPEMEMIQRKRQHRESQCGSQVSTNVSCKYDFIGKNTAQTKDHGTTLYTGGFIALLCVAMKAWKTKSVCLAPLKAVAAKAVWSYCG